MLVESDRRQGFEVQRNGPCTNDPQCILSFNVFQFISEADFLDNTGMCARLIPSYNISLQFCCWQVPGDCVSFAAGAKDIYPAMAAVFSHRQ